jgi:hypothetical protein
MVSTNSSSSVLHDSVVVLVRGQPFSCGDLLIARCEILPARILIPARSSRAKYFLDSCCIFGIFLLDLRNSFRFAAAVNMRSQKKGKYVIPRPRNTYNFGVALFVAVGSLCYGCMLGKSIIPKVES